MFYFKQFILHKQAEGLSNATITSYCYALKDFFQWLTVNKICNISENDIDDYFVFLRGKSYAATTLRDKYAVLHAYFNYCVQHGYLLKSPIKMRKPPLPKQRARCFTEEEIFKIIHYFDNIESFIKLRDYTIICILYSTGIRRNELLNITTMHSNFFVINGKGNKQRYVPLSLSLKQVLDKYIKERNKIAVCPFLIVTKDGTKLTTNGLRAIFTRLSNATGIGGKRFSAHTFRHSFATQFLKNGGDIVTLQKILGHSDIATTSIYLHWNDEAMAELNEKFNPLNNFKKFF